MNRSARPVDSSPLRRSVWVSMLVAMAAGLTLLTLLSPRTPHPEKAEWPSVARSNLVMRAACWYPVDSTNLFTGWMLDFHSDGSTQSRTAISNGLLNGLCESWFANGQIQSRESFKNSVSDGPRTKWHENGQLESQSTIVNGVMEGTFRRWHDNGQLAEQIRMEHGKANGLAIAYYPSGCVKGETRTQAGEILERQTWADGERRPPARIVTTESQVK